MTLPFAERELVAALGREPHDVAAERIPHPGVASATESLWRVRADGESLVLKVVRPPHGDARSLWPADEAEDAPMYWRREPLVYRSRLLHRLSGVRAPRCHAVTDREDGTVGIWLEDVALPAAAAGWRPERYGLAARQLGRAQAAYADAPPRDPWLSRSWLHSYLDRRAAEVERADDDHTRAVWAARERTLDRLERGPLTLCHLDLWPPNLFGDDEETVLIDWGFCGLGALGEDPGNLVPDALLDGFVPAAQARELAGLVLDGYLAGLHDGGRRDDDDFVRWAFGASAALKYVWVGPRLASGAPSSIVQGEPVLELLGDLWAESESLASSW